MGAVGLALAASLSWGVADFLAGLKSRALSLLAVMALSQAAGLALIATVVAVRAEGPPGVGSLLLAALGALSGLAGLAAFYRGLAVGAMAVVAPISGLAAAVPVAFGLLTGERPSGLQGAGMALAIAGVALASREETEAGPRAAAGAGLALLSALGFGGFYVALKEASESDVLWALLASRTASVSLLAVLCATLRPKLRLGRSDAGTLAGVGVLDVSANAFYALATTLGLVSVVAVLTSLYPLVVVALAFGVLGERVRPSQAVGALAALAGVALIASS